VAFIRDAACRKFDATAAAEQLSISGSSISLRRGLFASLWRALGASVGVYPSDALSRRARLHADKSHESIDNRAPRWKYMDPREASITCWRWRVEHVVESRVSRALRQRAQAGRPKEVSHPHRTWKSFALAIVAENVLRGCARHLMGQFVRPRTGASSGELRARITEQAGVVYSPFADRWSTSSDTDVNYMVVAEGMG